MRFLPAAIAFLASLALFVAALLHIGAANSDGTSAAGETGSTASYAVIPSEVLSAHAGAQTITVRGDGPLTAVAGREADVLGWVGESRHTTLALGSGGAITGVESGTDPAAPAVAGSDLWTEEQQGEGEVTVDAQLPPGYALLVAAPEGQAAASSVQISWPSTGRAPWSGPLLLGGALFLVLGLALLLWALLRLRERRRALEHPEQPVPVMSRRRDAEAEGAPVAVPAGPAAAPAAAAAQAPAATPAPASVAAPAVDATAELDAEPGSLADPAPVAAFQRPADADAGAGAGAPAEADASATTVLGVAAEPAHRGAPDAAASLADADGEPAADLGLADADGEPGPDLEPFDLPGEPAQADRPAVEPDDADRVATVAPQGSEAAAIAQEEAADPAPADLAAEVPRAQDRDDDGADGADAAADERRDDGPADDRRGGDGGSAPEAPAPAPAPGPADDDARWRRPRGRDRAQAPKRLFRLAPVLMVGVLGLSGCSAQMWPEALGGPPENPLATASSSVEQAILNEGAEPPAVSQAQLDRILADAASVAASADAAGDAAALAPRFADAALAERTALYAARAVDPALPAPAAFPEGDIVYAVPAATSAWPRTVLVVIQPAADAAVSLPTAVTLAQAGPRDPYKVASLVQLVPTATLPEAAPTSIGGAPLDEAAAALAIAPDELAAAYGDVVLNGEASANAARFDLAADPLLPQIGDAYRQGQLGAIDQAASKITFANRPGAQSPAGVGTLDGGAIIAVSLEEVETIAATKRLATIGVTGATAALAGTGTSSTGFERVYTDQLLFYVPTAESGGQARLLGYAQTLTSARQLDASEVTLA